MIRKLMVIVLFSSVFLLAQQSSNSAVDSVDPFIGTAEGGNTFPGATLPFGMIQWGPDTAADGWYHYPDKTIRGFSLTHISGAGCSIYGDVPILPWLGQINEPGSASSFALSFSHDREVARPGFYSVEFDNKIKAELTVSKRTGIGRFSFPAGTTRTLIFKAGNSATIEDGNRKADISEVQVRGTNTVVGAVHSGGFCGSDSNYVLYFAAVFAEPFSDFGTWDDSLRPGSAVAKGHRAGAYVSFPSSQKSLLMKVAVSFVSIENAEKNLRTEIPEWNFERARTDADRIWRTALSHVDAEGGTPEQLKVFYTGLYHMLLSPNVFNDANGDYIGFDGKVRKLPLGQEHYANFSDWDTYRNVIQLQSLLFPGETSKMMQSLVRDAEQSGWLPRWPVANDVSYVMGGDSSAILLASAHAFGARNFDAKTALQYMLKGATQPGIGLHNRSERPHLESYLKRGYIPLSTAGSSNAPTDTQQEESAASITLEYASADFAASRLAATLGQKTEAERLLRSAQNWRNLFDPESTFIRPRNSDGSFIEGWNPDQLLPHRQNWDQVNQLGFEEGSTWQYTWMVPHNYGGLLEAMGGAQNAIPKLDKFFTSLKGWGVPNYTVTNEPDFCAAYVYNWAGVPWKTQEVVDRVRREAFTLKPDGLPGNDDLGATSGVYVWNALGLYPVIPGVDGFALASPMFPKVTMRLGDGRIIQIASRGSGIYVQQVTLNGKPYEKSWLPLGALSHRVNRLEFVLGPEPNRNWATGPSNMPPSFDVVDSSRQKGFE